MHMMTPKLFGQLKARKRLDVDPPHLAPSCSLVRTSQGHLCELIYWLAPNADEDSPFACEHIALLSVADGTLVSADLSDEHHFAVAPESEVTLVKVQEETRYMRRRATESRTQ
jgi:hypothetical protein